MRRSQIALAVLLAAFALTGSYATAGQSEVATAEAEIGSDVATDATPRPTGTGMAMTVASHEAYVSGSFRAAMLETNLTSDGTVPGRARTLTTFGERLETRLEYLRQQRATAVRQYRSGDIDGETYRYRMVRVQARARVIERLSTTASAEVTTLPNGTGTERLDRSRFRGYARAGDSISRNTSRQLDDGQASTGTAADSSAELVLVGEEDRPGGSPPTDTDVETDPGTDDRTDSPETESPSRSTETTPDGNRTDDTPAEPDQNTTGHRATERNGTRDADVNPWHPGDGYDWYDDRIGDHEWGYEPDGSRTYTEDPDYHREYEEEEPAGWGSDDHRTDGWDGNRDGTDGSSDWGGNEQTRDGDEQDWGGDGHDGTGDEGGWTDGTDSTETPENDSEGGNHHDGRELDWQNVTSETEDGSSGDPDGDEAWSQGSNGEDAWSGESNDGDGWDGSSGDSDGWSDGTGDTHGWNDSSDDGDWGDGSSDGHESDADPDGEDGWGNGSSDGWGY